MKNRKQTDREDPPDKEPVVIWGGDLRKEDNVILSEDEKKESIAPVVILA